MINNPIKSLPSLSEEGVRTNVHVEVVPMTLQLVEAWRSFVQPFISGRYQHWSDDFIDHKTSWSVVRADKEWDWEENFKLLMLNNLTCSLQGKQSGYAIAMCIVLKPKIGDDEFPIGMLMAVPRLYTNVLSSKCERAFTWYLSDAPDEVFRLTLGINRVQGIARALLDCTIQAAVDERQNGELLLKADMNGGEKLVEFYKDKCGMLRLGADDPPVTKYWRTKEIDRYFYFDEWDSSTYCSLFDKRR